MPTQRPFFANFFSAFRARSTPGPFQAKSSTTTGAISPSTITASAQFSTIQANAAVSGTAPASISSKSTTDGVSQYIQTATAQPLKNTSTSAFATTTLSTSPGTTFYRRPPSPSPSHHNIAKPPHQSIPSHTTPTQMSRGRQRRDSSSSNSSGGFMDAHAMGSERWYVGGRTATGEERFYQLGLVTAPGSGGNSRVRSLDRLSL